MAKLAIDGGKPVRTRAWKQRGRRFGAGERKHLMEALEQNTLFYAFGKKTKQMIRKMTRLSGAGHAIGCSSGSAAIHGAVKACGVGPGDEVITTPITDAGTLLGIVYEGAVPVFADVERSSAMMTAKTIEKVMTPRTKAVVVVHLMGVPADIKPIVRLCRKRGVAVIEDCAQAWGAEVDGRWVGTFGDAGCFSLNDYKHISAGDGGVIITSDDEVHYRARLAVDKCYDRMTRERTLSFCAPNYRISELQSAVAIAQLGKVGRIARKRNELGERLRAGVEKIPGLMMPKAPRGAFSPRWFVLVGIDVSRFTVDAEQFAAALRAEGIPGGAGYGANPVYLRYPYLTDHSAFHHSDWPFSQMKTVQRYEPGLCPNAETAARDCFQFPLREEFSPKDMDDVVRALDKVAEAYRK